MKRYQNEIKSVWLKYIQVFLATISGFVLSIVFVKFFSAEEFGAYSFIMQLSTTITIITSFGLSATLIRFIPEYIQKRNYKSINTLIKYSILLRITGLFIVLSSILIFSKHFASYFNQNQLFVNILPFIIIFIFLNSINPLLKTIFYTAYSQEYVNDYIEIFKLSVITFVFWVLLQNDFGLFSIIITLIAVNIIIFILLGIKSVRTVRENNSKKKLKAHVLYEKRRIFRYGAYNFLSGTTGFLRDTAIDIFVISYFLNNEKVAFYALGSSLALYLSKINPAEILKNIFYPLIFKEFAAHNNDIEILKKYSLFLTKLALFTVMPFLVLIFVYAEEIINYIYDPNYSESILVLQIFAGFYFFRIFIRSYKVFFHSLEKNKIIFIASLLGVLNFIMSIAFVKYWEIAGVATSTGLTWAIHLFIFAYVLRYQLKVRFTFFKRPMLKLFVNIFMFTGLLIILKSLIFNVLSLILISVLSLIAYLFISRINKSFTEDERSFINSAIGYKIWKF